MQNLIRTKQHAIATKNGSTLITQNMNINVYLYLQLYKNVCIENNRSANLIVMETSI